MKKGNPKKRDWSPREYRLVAEFVAQFYPDHESRTHVHIGSLLPRWKGQYSKPSDQAMVGLFRRWADALVFLPDRTLLIEGKILSQPGVISQLNLYERLVPNTPELADRAHLPIEKLLVCAIEDPVVTQLAREQNIRVVVFRPAWIDAYLDLIEARKKQPSSTSLE